MKISLTCLIVSMLPIAASAVVKPDSPAAGTSSPSKRTVAVSCGNPAAKVQTLADGLKLIGDDRPATLLVSGTCRENVVIEGMDRVTLQGNPTATIDGGADPGSFTVRITDSRSIELTSLTITGGGMGVLCGGQSLCRLAGLTVQNSLAFGIFVGIRSHADIADTVIRNSADIGMQLSGGASASTDGLSVVGSATEGIRLGLGAGFLLMSGGSVSGNGGNGITVNTAGLVVLLGAAVTGNAGDGLALRLGSTARIGDSTVSANGGHQVRIGDLSSARFEGTSAVSGANFPDVVCDPVYSATRGFGTLVGTTTNCPAEQAPNP